MNMKVLFSLCILLLFPGESDACENIFKAVRVAAPLSIEYPDLYHNLLSARADLVRILKGGGVGRKHIQINEILNRLSDAISQISERSQSLNKIRARINSSLNRVEDSLRRNLRASLVRSQLTELNAILSEIIIGFEVWGLEKLMASSDDLYPEKMDPNINIRELRKTFPLFIGEADVIFAGEIGTTLGAQTSVIGLGEVKTLLRSRKLNELELQQARGLADYADKRTKMGQAIRVVYFFPIEAPTPSSIKKLRELGIQVITGY